MPACDHDSGPDQQAVSRGDQSGKPSAAGWRDQPEREADRQGRGRVAARVTDLDRITRAQLPLDPRVG